jgi:hypothetical protein
VRRAAPGADIGCLATNLWLFSEVLKVSVVAAIKMTVEAYVKEVGEIGPAARVVSLGSVSG